MAGSVSVLMVDATSCFYALGELLAITNANGGNSDPDQSMTTTMTTPQKNAWDAMFTYTDGLAIVTSFTFPIAIYKGCTTSKRNNNGNSFGLCLN